MIARTKSIVVERTLSIKRKLEEDDNEGTHKSKKRSLLLCDA